jgi:LPXTG-motif cell wall-anchored protein
VNLLKSPIRRTTAVLAGAFIGLAGAVAIAAPASAHTPEVVGSSTCSGTNGEWKVDWLVGNDFKYKAYLNSYQLTSTPAGADLTLTGDIVKPGQEIPVYSKGHPDQEIGGTTAAVPASVDSVTLTVELLWKKDGHKSSSQATVNRPENCKPTTPPTTPPPTTPPAQPGEPTPILEQDCTTMTVGLKNPADGEDITLNFKTNKGEERSDVIKPDESKSEKFSATPGFTVTLSIKGLEGSETVAYQQPDNCDTSGGGGGLPKTGAAAGSIAAGAAVLLIAGGVLFFVARRRRVKFTA